MGNHAWAAQDGFDVRFEWGAAGIDAVPGEVVVVVDVLRFTTAVDAAVSRHAQVFPYRWKDDSAADFAASVDAVLADGRDPAGPSLSPVALLELAPGARVVLPSPNGSTCALAAHERGATVAAACLRNAAAVARWLNDTGKQITVIACGERWPDGSLRPSLEDHIGAGAVIARLPRRWSRSPEAEAAAAVWRDAEPRLPGVLAECSSGRELIARGSAGAADVAFAAEADVSHTVPVLVDGSFSSLS